MSALRESERAAIEAVAKRYSATLGNGGDSPNASIKLAGERIGVHVRDLKRPGATLNAKPHLRFDKVATRLTERLKANIGQAVPRGTCVLVTVTAPIRLASKTAIALEGKIRTLLKGRSTSRGEKVAIHGNRIRIRVLGGVPEYAGKLITFVHNPETDPRLLFNLTIELLQPIRHKVDKKRAKLGGKRWLVLAHAGKPAWLETYRYICRQLHIGAGFERVLIIFDDHSIESLTG